MRIEHLEFLVEIAKTKSMSLAGQNLHVSHQGISSSINRLEDELGVILLNRTKNGVFLTETGEKYVNLTKQFLDDLAKLKAETIGQRLQEEVSNLSGSITINCAPMFNIKILPKVVPAFCKQHPKVKVVIRQMDCNEVLSSIAEKRADLGLIMVLKNEKNAILQELNIKGKVKIEKLFYNSIYTLVAKNSPLASRKSLSIKELLQYPLVTFYNSRNTVLHYIASHPDLYGEPSIIIDSESAQTNYSAISEGLAIGFITEHALTSFAHEIPENIKAIRISDKLNFLCGWVTNSSSELSPAAEIFLNLLKAHCLELNV